MRWLLLSIALGSVGCNSVSTGTLPTSATPVAATCTTLPPAPAVTDPRNGDTYTFGPHRTLLRNGSQTVNGTDWSNVIMTSRGPYGVSLGGWCYYSQIPDVWISAGYASDVLTRDELHPTDCPHVSIGGLE